MCCNSELNEWMNMTLPHSQPQSRAGPSVALTPLASPSPAPHNKNTCLIVRGQAEQFLARRCDFSFGHRRAAFHLHRHCRLRIRIRLWLCSCPSPCPCPCPCPVAVSDSGQQLCQRRPRRQKPKRQRVLHATAKVATQSEGRTDGRTGGWTGWSRAHGTWHNTQTTLSCIY